MNMNRRAVSLGDKAAYEPRPGRAGQVLGQRVDDLDHTPRHVFGNSNAKLVKSLLSLHS